MIGIKRASRTTCIKPSGTVSILAETSAGIHPHHSRYYIRRVRVSVNDPLYSEIKSKLPNAIEEIEGNKTTACILFACKSDGITKQTENVYKFLDRVLKFQKNWVLPGTAVERVKGLTHNVSNTTSFKEEDIEGVSNFIFRNQDKIKGFALMPVFEQEATFKNLPLETVKHNDQRFLELLKNDWSLIDFTVLNDEFSELKPALFCDSGKCELV